jgi:hypothetical protein
MLQRSAPLSLIRDGMSSAAAEPRNLFLGSTNSAQAREEPRQVIQRDHRISHRAIRGQSVGCQLNNPSGAALRAHREQPPGDVAGRRGGETGTDGDGCSASSLFMLAGAISDFGRRLPD